MKKGWTYKKLGDLCTIERGGSPRPIAAFITDSNDGLNWIKIGDATDGSKYITSTKEKIREEGLKKTRLVHKGDFILSNSMSFGRPYILEIDGCIHDGWLVIHDDKEVFNKSYLYYVLESPNMYREFQRLAVGGVVNNLNTQIVRNVVVPVPPHAEQERIVAELDLLTGIIDMQKRQLAELDTLAQSIFYDMFGDPVVNEKGWKTDKLKSVAPERQCDGVVSGTNGKYWLLNLDMVAQQTGMILNKVLCDSKDIGDSTIMFDASNVLFSKLRPYLNKVVLPDSFGYGTSEFVPLKPVNTKLNRVFLAYLLRSKAFVNYISGKVAGAKMPRVSLDVLRMFPIILPPLLLQESFAEDISSIDKQKASIKRSIAESQKLFDYTMDKYFG